MNAALKRNPVFWIMWLLPGAAVLAGFATLAIALQHADRALPAIYHWEGELLDADFERARQSARLGIEADLRFADGACELNLRGADAPQLRLMFTNGIDVHQDRVLTLFRGADGVYRNACEPLTAGKWRIALQDAALTWALRADLDSAATHIRLRARAPDGSAS